VSLGGEPGPGLGFEVAEVLVERPEQRLDALVGDRDGASDLGRNSYLLA
jgi:hypothetical protein